MPTHPQIDQYILKSQDFAQPILHHLRALIHHVCPEVEEKMKWSMPFFDYKGEMMCNLAAFKQHCAMGFWKAALMKDKVLLENASAEASMGHLGRITSLKDLPSDKKIMAWIKEAMILNEKGIKVTKEKPISSALPEIHPAFKKALKANPIAMDSYTAFTPGAKKEYILWINEAKTDATRHKRLLQAIEWIAEGKKRNWKYEK